MEVSPDLVSKLNYGTSTHLETVAKRVKASKEIGVNIVREHPYYSNLPNCKMAEKIKEIESRLANQKFSALHPSMTKSKDCLVDCIKRTDETDASLQDANHVYNEILPIMSNICEVYSNPLELTDRCSQLIKKFHECWDARHKQLKNFSMAEAEAMLAEGIKHLELAVKSGSEEAELAVSAVIEEDTKKFLKNFEDEVTKLQKFVADSIKDYQEHDKKLGEDLKTLDGVITEEKKAYEDETTKHKNTTSNLREKIKINHEKQEELRRQLKLLEKEEQDLMTENGQENHSHCTNTKSYHNRRDNLCLTKSNFMKLKNASEGCTEIMGKVNGASDDLSSCCLKTKKNTNKLMMDTHKTAFERYREALATLIITYKVQIRDSKKNIDYLQKQLDHLKVDLEAAVQGALNVVVEQKRAEVGRYQRALVQQKDIIKASQDRVETLEDALVKCDKELEVRHNVKPEGVAELYNKRVDTIDTRWKSDGIGNDHIEKLSLLPDPELRGDTIRSLTPAPKTMIKS